MYHIKILSVAGIGRHTFEHFVRFERPYLGKRLTYLCKGKSEPKSLFLASRARYAFVLLACALVMTCVQVDNYDTSVSLYRDTEIHLGKKTESIEYFYRVKARSCTRRTLSGKLHAKVSATNTSLLPRATRA